MRHTRHCNLGQVFGTVQQRGGKLELKSIGRAHKRSAVQPSASTRQTHPREPRNDPLEALLEGVPPLGLKGHGAGDGGQASQAGAGALSCEGQVYLRDG